MKQVWRWLDSVGLEYFLVFALSLGLAPFFPEPHLVQKLQMLAAGQLTRPIDIFDLFFHATPWVLLILKLARMFVFKPDPEGN